jgi:hypothetical protein
VSRWLSVLLAGYFICHVEDGQLKCFRCGDPDLGCTAIYAVAKKQEEFKASNAPTVQENLDGLTARVNDLERKTKIKGERP